MRFGGRCNWLVWNSKGRGRSKSRFRGRIKSLSFGDRARCKSLHRGRIKRIIRGYRVRSRSLFRRQFKSLFGDDHVRNKNPTAPIQIACFPVVSRRFRILEIFFQYGPEICFYFGPDRRPNRLEIRPRIRPLFRHRPLY